jgi:hypothetical protein
MSREEILAKMTRHEEEVSNAEIYPSLFESSTTDNNDQKTDFNGEVEQDSNIERTEMTEDLEEKIRHLTEEPGDEDEIELERVISSSEEIEQAFDMISEEEKGEESEEESPTENQA